MEVVNIIITPIITPVEIIATPNGGQVIDLNITTTETIVNIDVISTPQIVELEIISTPQIVQIDITESNGLSAYQLALIAGFVGSFDEWIASLKGDKGDAGTGVGHYTHRQLLASTLWEIPHMLGYNPAITLKNLGGGDMFAKYRNIDLNNAEVDVGSFLVAGSAECR